MNELGEGDDLLCTCISGAWQHDRTFYMKHTGFDHTVWHFLNIVLIQMDSNSSEAPACPKTESSLRFYNSITAVHWCECMCIEFSPPNSISTVSWCVAGPMLLTVKGELRFVRLALIFASLTRVSVLADARK